MFTEEDGTVTHVVPDFSFLELFLLRLEELHAFCTYLHYKAIKKHLNYS